jgi:uncharacterized protein (TIGR02266 family)
MTLKWVLCFALILGMGASAARPPIRPPTPLRIKFQAATVEEFIERYRTDVSRAGIFIRTTEAPPLGSAVKLDFRLRGGASLLSGTATVAWIRESDPARPFPPPGMGLRFRALDGPGQLLIERIAAEKTKRGEDRAESRYERGFRKH